MRRRVKTHPVLANGLRSRGRPRAAAAPTPAKRRRCLEKNMIIFVDEREVKGVGTRVNHVNRWFITSREVSGQPSLGPTLRIRRSRRRHKGHDRGLCRSCCGTMLFAIDQCTESPLIKVEKAVSAELQGSSGIANPLSNSHRKAFNWTRNKHTNPESQPFRLQSDPSGQANILSP